jgi:hypothetical protein
MASADDLKAYRKWKKDTRLSLNKKYPNGGKEFIKAVNEIQRMSFAKWSKKTDKTVKAIKPSQVVNNKKVDNTKEKVSDNIPVIKKEIKKVVSDRKTKDMPIPRSIPEGLRKSIAKTKTATSNASTRTKDIKMVTLKSGKMGTIQQRLAEIDAEKKMDAKKEGMKNVMALAKKAAKESQDKKAKKANKGMLIITKGSSKKKKKGGSLVKKTNS